MPFYKEYRFQRTVWGKTPYFYCFAASLFQRLKRFDLAELALSNVVEVRPGEARWLGVYATTLTAWGRGAEMLEIFRAVATLRRDDPNALRDYGLALEAAGRPEEALAVFEQVLGRNWGGRYAHVRTIVASDAARAGSAMLRSTTLSAEARANAQRYASRLALDADRVVITVSWDASDVGIDLHVVEPGDRPVHSYGDRDASAVGRIIPEDAGTVGPVQYRAAAAYRGHYRAYVTYSSRNRTGLRDGVFVRADLRLGVGADARTLTRTVFLRDEGEVRTVVEFDNDEPQAPQPPANFATAVAQAKMLLKSKRYQQALRALEGAGVQRNPSREAERFFHMARAYLGMKQYDQAEVHNTRALALDPEMLAAHFNNACAGALARDKRRALRHLNLLADALQRRPADRARFLRLIATDADLASLRALPDFGQVKQRMIIGH
jgi:tetratricopeptide (TPR) repeat protein